MKTVRTVGKNSKRIYGYTLLEVVLMLLAMLLLTIGLYFFYQGYALNTRNTKRMYDMKHIETSIGIKQGQGASLMDFVSTNASGIPDISLGGTTIEGTNERYRVGKVDGEKLELSEVFLRDPLSGYYQIGVTTIGGGRYQMASVKEDGDNLVGYTYGNYAPRTRNAMIQGNFSNGTLMVEQSSREFRVGDVLADDSGFTGKLVQISPDGKLLSFGPESTFSGSKVNLHLYLDESPGLIMGRDKAGLEGIVINGGKFFPAEVPNQKNVSETEMIHSLTP